MAEKENIILGSLQVDDSERAVKLADLAYYANAELAPNGGGFGDEAFHREIQQSHAFIDYLEVDGEIAAYITSRYQMFGKGENKTDVPMLEAVTSKEHRGKGYRKKLLEYILEKVKSPAFGLHTWRVDSVIGDKLPSDYPPTEQPVHDVARAIIRGEQVDAAAHMDEISRIARVVKVDDANTELGFRLVNRANGERDSHVNYIFLRPESGKTLDQLDVRLNIDGSERIGKLRQFLTGLKQPDIYQPPAQAPAAV